MKVTKRFSWLSLCLALLLFAAGCNTTESTNNPPPPSNLGQFPTLPASVGFDLGANPAVAPFPNSIPNVLKSSVTGLNTIPNNPPSDPVTATNLQTGWSTSGQLLIPLVGTVQAATVNNNTVQVVNVATGIAHTMVVNVVNSGGNSTIILTPQVPLLENTTYVVIVTSGIIDTNGNPLSSNAQLSLLKDINPLIDANGNPTTTIIPAANAAGLEPVRQGMQAGWLAAENITGLSRRDIPLAYIYETADLHNEITNLVNGVTAGTGFGPIPDPSFPAPTGRFAAAPGLPPGVGAVLDARLFAAFDGGVDGTTIEVANNIAVNLPPVVVGTLYPTGGVPPVIPLAVVDPDGGGPAIGVFDVVAAGFNAALGTTFTGADLAPFTAAGIGTGAGVARIFAGSIDVPWFLPADDTDLNGFFSSPAVQTQTRRIPFLAFTPLAAPKGTVVIGHGLGLSKLQAFTLADFLCAAGWAVIAIDHPDHGFLNPGVDLVNNATRQPPADGIQDADGGRFINLTSLRRSRDNIRQAIINLSVLAGMVANGQTNIPGLPTARPVYLGHSLGAIIGGSFVALNDNVRVAALNVGGGRLSQLLQNSGTFAPAIIAGLAAQGINAGTVDFLRFFILAQTIVDTVDPINLSRFWLNGGIAGNPNRIAIQMIENDGTVPNSSTLDLALSSLGLGLGVAQIAPTPAQFLLPLQQLAVATAANTSGFATFTQNTAGDTHNSISFGPFTDGTPPGIDAGLAMRLQLFGNPALPNPTGWMDNGVFPNLGLAKDLGALTTKSGGVNVKIPVGVYFGD